VEAIGSRAPELRIVGRDPAREQLPDVRLFARIEHQLPAPVRAHADQVGRRPRRLAVLDADLRQLLEPARAHQQIDHQPALVEIEILVLDAESAAHRAAGAVAADDVFRRDGAIAQPQLHFLFRWVEALELGEGNLGDRRGPVAQQRIDCRLVEHHAGRPAERPGRRQRAQALDELAVDAVILGGREGRGMRSHRIADADVFEHAHDLVIERERARLVVHCLLALDGDGLQAEAAEQGGADRASGAEADDGHIEAIIHLPKHAI